MYKGMSTLVVACLGLAISTAHAQERFNEPPPTPQDTTAYAFCRNYQETTDTWKCSAIFKERAEKATARCTAQGWPKQGGWARRVVDGQVHLLPLGGGNTEIYKIEREAIRDAKGLPCVAEHPAYVEPTHYTFCMSKDMSAIGNIDKDVDPRPGVVHCGEIKTFNIKEIHLLTADCQEKYGQDFNYGGDYTTRESIEKDYINVCRSGLGHGYCVNTSMRGSACSALHHNITSAALDTICRDHKYRQRRWDPREESVRSSYKYCSK